MTDLDAIIRDNNENAKQVLAGERDYISTLDDVQVRSLLRKALLAAANGLYALNAQGLAPRGTDRYGLRAVLDEARIKVAGDKMTGYAAASERILQDTVRANEREREREDAA